MLALLNMSPVSQTPAANRRTMSRIYVAKISTQSCRTMEAPVRDKGSD
jgi:hypothetical protein